MSRETREENRRTDKKYREMREHYDKSNARNRDFAQEDAERDAVEAFERWQDEHDGCDIIIHPDSDGIDEIIKGEHVVVAPFNVDGERIEGYGEYQRTTVTKTPRIVTKCGGVSCYHVSETLGGYSVSPDYSATSKETVYDLDYEDTYADTLSVIRAKAVKRGTAAEVIRKEKQLAPDYAIYTKAKQYRKKPSDIKTPLKATRLYRALCVVHNALAIVCALFFALCFPESRQFFLEALLIDPLPAAIAWGELILLALVIADAACVIGMYFAKEHTTVCKDGKMMTMAVITVVLLAVSYLCAVLCEYVPFLRGLLGTVLLVGMNVKILSLVIGVIWLIVALVLLIFDPASKRIRSEREEVARFAQSEKFAKCKALEREIHSYTVR